MKHSTFQEALQKLEELGQGHLLQDWDRWSSDVQYRFLKELDQLDVPTFLEQQKLLHAKSNIQSPVVFKEYFQSGSTSDFKQGQTLISQGQVGCLVVAGGQGTRLNFEGPKGMFPVSIIQHKTLFQLLAERVLAASTQMGRPLLLAIMTSSSNQAETLHYFHHHHFFGLESDQVSFFQQADLPFLDLQGNLFLEEPGKISEGPDGNGSALEHFVKKGIWSSWYQQGVRYLNFIFIDNPLAGPFDAELIGFHQRQGGDIIIKCVKRRDAEEKVGVIVELEGAPSVMEYSEMPPEEFRAQEGNVLKHPLANISLFSFKMDFIKKEHALPLHKALKKNAWKFERFIFDLIPFAQGVKALLYPREVCFSPLKNASGLDSLKTVQEALLHSDRQIFKKITGNEPPKDAVFELAPEFYYPTPDLLYRWKGKPFPGPGYIKS